MCARMVFLFVFSSPETSSFSRLNPACERLTNASISCCLLREVIYCTSERGFSLSEGIMCALITVCAKRVVSVAMRAGAVRWSGWYGAEVRQMGEDAFCTGSGKIKCLPASRPFSHSLRHSPSIALSICLSLPLSLSHSPSNSTHN